MDDWTFPEGLRKMCFETAAESPASWFFAAHDLFEAAERVSPDEPSPENADSLGLFGVHRMPMGMSSEALLKGLLVARGESPLKGNGERAGRFQTHSLSRLAEDLAMDLDPEDAGTLDNLSHCIRWAGRYPIPTSNAKLIIKGYSDREYRREHAIWERLMLLLKSEAWVLKADGRRFYFDRSKNEDSDEVPSE